MRLLVCGGRNFGVFAEERNFIRKHILETLCPGGDCRGWDRTLDIIISGMAVGTDSIAADFAWDMGITLKDIPITPEEWARYGRAAGPRRNRRMIVEGKPDAVLAFNGGPGTRNMIQQARNNDIPVIERLYGSFKR